VGQDHTLFVQSENTQITNRKLTLRAVTSAGELQPEIESYTVSVLTYQRFFFFFCFC